MRTPLSVLLLAAAAAGQISVQGLGVAEAPTVRLVLRVRIAASAELASEAASKFDQARRRALETLEKTALAGLTTKGMGVEFTLGADATTMMQMAMMGREDTTNELLVQVTERLEVRLPLADLSSEERVTSIAKALDALRDSGATMDDGTDMRQQMMRMWTGDFSEAGTTSALSFEPQDGNELEDRALELAVKAARRRAGTVAKIIGTEVGKVTAITANPDAAERISTPDRVQRSVRVQVSFQIP